MLAAVLAVTTLVAPAVAGVFIGSEVSTTVDSLAEGVVMLDYGSGTTTPFTGDAVWDAGTKSATADDGSGNLALAHSGAVPPSASPTWWDTTWTSRQCFVVDNPGPGSTEVPIKVKVDTTGPAADNELGSDGAGLRAVSSTSGTELPLWVEGQIPSPATSVWVQLADAPAGPSEFCLYWGNVSAPTVSDQASVFTFSTPRLTYYTLTDSYTGGTGSSGQLSVVSYVDGNQITVDGVTTVGNRGQPIVFTNVTRNSIITATAPLAGSGLGNATDSVVPESYADTEFIFPTMRQVQTIWVRAPFGTVNLELRHGTTVTTVTVTPGDGAVGIPADAVGSNTIGDPGEGVAVRSTNGVPFLAMNTSQANDSILGVPFTGESLYGLRSRDLRIGAGFSDTGYALVGSDGTDLPSESVIAGYTNTYYNGADVRGNGTGFKVTSSGGRIAAVQQADADGSESTAFMPSSLLDDTYFVPQAAGYIAMVCPVPGQSVTMTLPNGTQTVHTCANPGGVAGAPGRTLATGAIPAGTELRSSSPFFAYIDEAGLTDETNLVGAVAALRRGLATFPTTARPVEGTYAPSGVWDSAVIDTGPAGVYGTIQLTGSLPPGSTAALQVASGATAADAATAPFVGPDGTTSTLYGIGSGIMDQIHDNRPFLRFRVILASIDPLATPSIGQIAVTTGLQEFPATSNGGVEIAVAGGSGPTTHLLARLSTETGLDSVVRINYAGGTGLADAVDLKVRTDHPDTHVAAVNGAIVAATGAEHPLAADGSFELFLDEDTIAGSTVTLDTTISFEFGDDLLIQKDVRFVISG